MITISNTDSDSVIEVSADSKHDMLNLEGGSDVDPMANIANLVDVMLVLACGLMLALVSYWQIELPNVSEIVNEQELKEVQEVEEINESVEAAGSTYSELGTVYEDSSTGKKYMITN